MISQKMEKVYKIVMLGDEAVGKTSIIIQHVEKRFDESYKMTIGTDISAKLMQLDGQNIYMLIWDIGGQEKYKILRESYLKGAFGGIIVYDVTKKSSFDHVMDWYEESREICGDIPLILVGNKIDLADDRKILETDGQRLAKEINADFFETSAKTGEKIDLVFEKLVNKIIKK
ncbi:MAG: Rab family GTPase [Candidatus Helarchaeota archaeon]